MLPFFMDLLHRGWQVALANGSSTGISVFWLGFGVLVLGFLFTIGIEWFTGGRSMISLIAAMKSWKSWAGAALALFVGWVSLLAYSTLSVVYHDHQNLVTAAARTCTQNAQRDPNYLIQSAVPRTKESTKINTQIKQNGNDNKANPGTVAAPINQGPCSVVQNGGSGNSATPICAPLERKISESEKNQIVLNLRSSCPFPVAVRPITGNAESMKYADELVEALRSAGCTPQNPRFLIDTAASYGVTIAIHDFKNVPSGADALELALTAAHIKWSKEEGYPIEYGVTYIMVGLNDSKPK